MHANCVVVIANWIINHGQFSSTVVDVDVVTTPPNPRVNVKFGGGIGDPRCLCPGSPW